MLRASTAKLPPEQQQRLHADFLANEQAYLQMRDSLLSQYRGQWVAVHDGHVIAAGDDLLAVTEQAVISGGHPFIAKVGEEDKAIFRVRRAQFSYDSWAATCSTATASCLMAPQVSLSLSREVVDSSPSGCSSRTIIQPG